MKRFPIGLTISAAVAFAILCGLGGWQLKRLAWKQDLLARIEALKTAPAVPIESVIRDAEQGRPAPWRRVSVQCDEPMARRYPQRRPTRPSVLRYALREGEIVWRATAFCPLASDPSKVVGVDRGFVDATRGQMKPAIPDIPPIKSVEGVLVPSEALGRSAAAPSGKAEFALETDVSTHIGNDSVVLMAEHETPAPRGLTPSAVPPDIPNRHLEYALTWFGLAGALAAVYAALLRRRLKAA